MVDVTGSKRSQTAREIDEAVRRSAESRGGIEQAKGVVMATLGVGPDAYERELAQQGATRLPDPALELGPGIDDTRDSWVDDPPSP